PVVPPLGGEFVVPPLGDEFVVPPLGGRLGEQNNQPPKNVTTTAIAANNPQSAIRNPQSEILQQQPGATITYTITPSGNIPTGEAIDFLPVSRTVTLGNGGTISFTAAKAEPSQTVDASFCGRSSVGLKIGGGVTMQPAYSAETIPIGLHLTNEKAPGCSLPTDISTNNSAGSYLVDNANPATRFLGLEGSYQITPNDPRFDFNYQPAGMSEDPAGTVLVPPLNGSSLGWNFNAYAVNTCPASITATANGETDLQVCEGQPINLETPAVPGATSYTWTLPNNTMIAGRTPIIASATLANSGTYKVQVSTPTCVTPVETMIQVTVNPAATANAGTDQSQCKAANGTTVFTLNGSASAGASIVWTVENTTGDAAATVVNISSLTSMVNVTGSGNVTLQLNAASPFGCGIASDQIVLSVSPGSTSISAQPVAQSVCLGTAANFSVTATGTNLTYQWRKNSVNIPGKTNSTLSIPAAQLSDAGNYDVVVTGTGCSPVISTAVALIVNSYEADVSPNQNGDCQLTMADWVRAGNIISGTVAGLSAAELQRADSAPRNTFGNGLLTVADWVQAGRYAAALDPLVQAGGPSVSAPALLMLANDGVGSQTVADAMARFTDGLFKRINHAEARTLRLRDENLRSAKRIIEIELDARGEENAIGFSLNFAPGSWRLQSATLSDELGSATLMVNRSEAKEGRLGFVVSLPIGQKLPAGRYRIASLRFSPTVSVTKAAELSTFNFGDLPVSRELVDANAESLPLNFARDDFAPLTVVSAADFAQQKLAVESIAVAFGEKLATNSIIAKTLPLPDRLADTQIVITDNRGVEHFAPLFSASDGQAVFLVPPDTAPGFATVAIRNSDNRFSVASVEIAKTAPAIFNDCGSRIADCGFAPAAVLLRTQANGLMNYEPLTRNDLAQQQSATRNSQSAIPVRFGENDQLVLVLFGTGLRHHRGEIAALLGDVPLPVLYAGAQNEMTGLDQINLALPRWLAGSGEMVLRLSVNGQPTELRELSRLRFGNPTIEGKP
nr:hypothetical protein [Acidobacteriota bacterium]